MTEPRNTNREAENATPATSRNDDQIPDLDFRPDDIEKVKGGLRGDPCDGGEISKRLR